jgi:hypothetical protein
MAISWNFDNTQYTEQSFELIPVGEHRVRIAQAEESTSLAGNQMIKLTLEVSGHNGKLFHNLVFLTDRPDITNQKLGELFNSFEIQPGNFNLASWIGKVGAAKVKHEVYNNENQAKVWFFIGKERQASLPAWQEPSNKAAVTGQAPQQAAMPVVETNNLPWA